eukprot:5675483-Pyramimonas_sp.AAC.1
MKRRGGPDTGGAERVDDTGGIDAEEGLKQDGQGIKTSLAQRATGVLVFSNRQPRVWVSIPRAKGRSWGPTL